jgi:type II secretory pathway component PulK
MIGRKGQIFSLDVLLAVLAITVILGYTAYQFEIIYSESADLEYQKMQSMANDWSQIAVKRLIVDTDKPNMLLDDLSSLEAEMDAVIEFPYAYSVSLAAESINPSACAGKSNIASSRRLVLVNGVVEELIVEVCV